MAVNLLFFNSFPHIPATEIVQKMLPHANIFMLHNEKQSTLSTELKVDVEQIINTKASAHGELEKIQTEWFEGMHSANLPISGTIIRQKTARDGPKLRTNYFNFKVSNR
jgi:hypothetical protein